MNWAKQEALRWLGTKAGKNALNAVRQHERDEQAKAQAAHGDHVGIVISDEEKFAALLAAAFAGSNPLDRNRLVTFGDLIQWAKDETVQRGTTSHD